MRKQLLPIVSVTLVLAAPSLAQTVCYRLGDDSAYQEGCLACGDPCAVPLSPEYPLRGRFALTLQSLSQFGTIYHVTDVHFEVFAPPPADPPSRVFTGSGTYSKNRPRFGDPNHVLSLDLSVDGAPARTFVNLPAADPNEFPAINLEIADNGFVCQNIILDIRAVPACPCERTCDDVTDVFDLLAYLNLWFAQDPAADLDEDPAITVFDLLVYLDCWFGGC